ncbi:hypothetical protein N7520_001361 [Penicillium odoratum]|uniref:uncharacterized protein n=1 Tax=Penicillium odoratum TaxID=1167516 RepID=UPI002548569E|nr:uncharacterized protein N7520_001361 [Penicillium odoratum]KAJ5778115.1 hypothetical protein N7520_001361 [Penicillium odoratum]
MARAAVLPPSPAKRGARAAPRTTLNKTAKAKTAEVRKRAPVKATAPQYDSDDTDDELGMMMKEPAQVARPQGRPARSATGATAASRGRNVTPAASEQPHAQATSNVEPKKRVGRPKKTQVDPPAKVESAPKPRGRPKAATTKATTTTRKTTRAVAEAQASVEDTGTKNILIATNSTTMRSNLLRGPAKKKTVTFEDVSDSEEDVEEPAAPVGRKKASAKGAAGKAGLRATPMRKAIATGRGRKPAAKKNATKPLSPKKDKQVAKSLSAYASSDGEEDELSAVKDNIKSPVKLIIHSPVKHASEPANLSSPVRKINFTPKKASSLIDENGEPKLPTPKHGSSTTGLSSPVRKINFTPNRSQHTVTDNDHLALPPGKAMEFSDSVFMSSPARRPEQSSPFRFSFRNTPNRGSLFRDDSDTAPTFDLSHGASSPLKMSARKGLFRDVSDTAPAFDLSHRPPSPLRMSPRKAHLGASFSQLPSKTTTPSFPARSSFIQSPAKRIPSPFKGSIFSAESSVNESTTPSGDSTVRAPLFSSTNKRLSSYQEEEEPVVDEDLEMVEEVARDIFGIELQSSSRTPTQSPSPQQVLDTEKIPEPQVEEAEDVESVISDAEEVDIDEKIEELQEEIRREPDDFGTICFNTMEDLQESFRNLPTEDITEPNAYSDIDSVHEDESDGDDELADDFVEQSFEPILELAPSPANEVEYSVRGNSSESPLDLAIFQDSALQQPESPTPVRNYEVESIEDDYEENDVEESGSVVHSTYEEQEAESEEDEVVDDEPTAIPSEATLAVPPPQSPYEMRNREESPLSRMGSATPRASTPARQATPLSLLESATSRTPFFEINNTHERMDIVNSPMETTQSEIPTPAPLSFSGSPSVRRRRSGFNVNLGFTPLASKLGRWETNTPSQERPARPRRRGVFSLVGPLERSAQPHIPDEGDIPYPDLSRRSLATTPRLFSELPLRDYNEDSFLTSGPHSPEKSSSAQEDDEMINSPSRSDIFEDLEPIIPEHLRPRESLPNKSIDDHKQNFSEEDKENLPAPSLLPATPMKAVPEHLRTFHTVSKVPLKGEGEASPLKIPRKRGLSLSNTSPSRSSSRIRNSIFPPRKNSAPDLSPRKEIQVPRSPSPKRRCSEARRSSARVSSMAPPRSPSVVSSPGQTPRRKASPKKQALRGAVVYVDVHTTEGEDASGIFIELLQQMGARCFKSWSWNPRTSMSPVDGVDPSHSVAKVGITHVVYKDGGLRTLEKVKQAAGLVKCVGVGWVLDCEREGKWVDETPYAIDRSIIPRGGAKRRKSMEPRALSNVNGTLVRVAEPSTPSASGRRCGADRGAIEGFRKITPPTPVVEPSTPTQQSYRSHVPQTPGYNFSNLDAIGMSPATPYFLSNRTKLVQQSCPPKQSGRGLFPESKPALSFEEEDDQDARRQQRARMEAARRKSLFHKPAVASPLAR